MFAAHIVYAWMYIYVWRSLLAPNSYVDVVRRDRMPQSEYLLCTYVAVEVLTLLPPATPMLDNILPGNKICLPLLSHAFYQHEQEHFRKCPTVAERYGTNPGT